MIDQTVKLEKKVEEQEKELSKVDLLEVDYDQKIKLLLEKNKEDKKSMEERLDKIQQENKEREQRLLSLIAKESIVGMTAIPTPDIDLVRSGELSAIPLDVSDRNGEDIKHYTIHKDIESVKNNPIKGSKKLKSKPVPSDMSKLIILEDPATPFKLRKRKV